MKILVTYFSQTGNTKKIAETFFAVSAAKGHQVDLRDVTKVTSQDLNEYALVFIGSTCHSADIAKPVVDLLEGVEGGAKFKLAGFVTHSTHMPEASEYYREMYERWAGKCEGTFERLSREKGFGFLGYFHCQGAPSSPIADFIHAQIIPDQKEFDEYLKDAMPHPDQKDIAAANQWSKTILEQVA